MYKESSPIAPGSITEIQVQTLRANKDHNEGTQVHTSEFAKWKKMAGEIGGYMGGGGG
jgi:hypothetical protein